jgi:hypothetical protein
MGPQDFKKMAETLSLLEMVGSVIPFRQRSLPTGEVPVPPVIGPMGGGGGSGRSDWRSAIPPKGTPEWRAYQADLSMRLAEHMRNAAAKAGHRGELVTDPMMSNAAKYEMAIKRQRGEE